MQVKKGILRILGISAIMSQLNFIKKDLKRLSKPFSSPKTKKALLWQDVIYNHHVSDSSLKKQYFYRYVSAWIFLFIALISIGFLFEKPDSKLSMFFVFIGFVMYIKNLYFMYLICNKKLYVPFVKFLVAIIRQKALLPRKLPRCWIGDIRHG